MSARFMSVAASVPCVGANAMPMLPPTSSAMPATGNGAESRLRISCASATAASTSRTCGQHDRVLVAAEPADGRVLVERGADAAGDEAQHFVAGVVAERLVDVLEPVEVHQQHTDRFAAAPLVERFFESLEQVGRGSADR